VTEADSLTLGASTGNTFDLATSANGAITLGGNITATIADLTAHGSGDIVYSSGTLSATTANLTSTSGNIGASGSRIQTSAGTLTANTSGNVYVTEADSLTLGASTGNTFDLTTSANGAITLDGNITATTLALTANGSGNILYTSGLITANNLSLTSTSGSLGASGNRILTQVGTLNLSTTGSGAVYLSEADGLTFSASSDSGLVDVVTGGALSISSVSSSGGSNLSFQSGGSLSNTGAIVTTGTLSLDTQGTIALTNLDTGSITVTSSNASNVSLQSTGNLSIASLETGGAGDISLTSGGWLQDTSDAGDSIMTTGNLTLVSAGAIGANSTPGLNINVGGTVTATSTAGSITLTQGANLHVGNITAGGGGNINLYAESGIAASWLGIMAAEAGDIDLNGLVSGANVVIEAAGNIADGNGVSNNLLATAGATLRAGGYIWSTAVPLNVNVSGGLLNVWAAGMSSGVSVDINGTVAVGNTLTRLNSPPGQIWFNGLLLYPTAVSTPPSTGGTQVVDSQDTNGYFSQWVTAQQNSSDSPEASDFSTLDSRLIIPTIQNRSIVLIQGFKPPNDLIPTIQELQKLLLGAVDGGNPQAVVLGEVTPLRKKVSHLVPADTDESSTVFQVLPVDAQ